jgi:hypothetical protein
MATKKKKPATKAAAAPANDAPVKSGRPTAICSRVAQASPKALRDPDAVVHHLDTEVRNDTVVCLACGESGVTAADPKDFHGGES